MKTAEEWIADYYIKHTDSQGRTYPIHEQWIEAVKADARKELEQERDQLKQANEELREKFKVFHKNLCNRFNAVHDENDWQRDLCSLEEHLAKQLTQLAASNK